jgi:hypothetical protein
VEENCCGGNWKEGDEVMEEQLKDLPEILNQGRLKSVAFKEEHRQKVLQKVRAMNRPPAPKHWFYHWFHQSLSLALGVVFILIFIQYFQDMPDRTKSVAKQSANQAVKLPYANQAILTKVRHDMWHQYKVTNVDARQSGDTLTVYLTYPADCPSTEQLNLTKVYLREVSHLTLNEPYGAQTYLGELWKYVNVKVYSTASDDLLIASKQGIEFSYDWFGTIDTDHGKLTWEKIQKQDNPFEKGISN